MDMMSEKVSSSLFAEVVLPVLGADGLPKRSASLIAGAAGFWVFFAVHAVEAGRDNGDHHLVFHRLVECSTPNDVCILLARSVMS